MMLKVLKGLLLIYVIGYGLINVIRSQDTYGENAPKPELNGLFKITHFEKNDDTISTDVNNYERWRYLILERKGSAQIHKIDKSKHYYKSEIDTLKSEIKLTSYQDSTDSFVIFL